MDYYCPKCKAINEGGKKAHECPHNKKPAIDATVEQIKQLRKQLDQKKIDLVALKTELEALIHPFEKAAPKASSTTPESGPQSPQTASGIERTQPPR
jgi:hypothetical protein